MIERSHLVNLTPSQQGMLYHCLAETHASLYVSQAEINLNEPIIRDSLWKAWGLFFERHEILRSGLVQDVHGSYLLKIHKGMAPEKSFFDLSKQDVLTQRKEITSFKRQDLKKGVDLTQPPLMRLTLFKLSDSSYILICTYHHIILCAPSAIQGLYEVFNIYESLCGKKEVALPAPMQYREIAQFINANSNLTPKEYWLELLSGYDVTTELPFNPISQGIKLKPDAHHFELPNETYVKIKKICKQFSLTPSIVFQFVWGVSIAKYINRDDIIIGVVRAYPANKIKNGLGLFINTLPLRIRYSESTSILDCLEYIKEQTRCFKKQAYISLTKLLRSLDFNLDIPLFNAAIDVKPHNYIEQLTNLDKNWSNRGLNFHTETHYPLMLEVWVEEKQFFLKINYNASLFQKDKIKQFSHHALNILFQVLEAPQKMVSELHLMTAKEIQHLDSWNNTTHEYSNFQPIPQLFSGQAKKTPNGVALKFGSERLTYKELDNLTDQLATYLLKKNEPESKYVVICLDRSLDLVIAIYAIWKAGLAYVPLDPQLPKKRKELIIAEVAPFIILAQDNYTKDFEHGHVFDIARLLAKLKSEKKKPFQIHTKMDDIAYVLFTSGTTGVPKGVVISHRNLSNRILWMQAKYLLSPVDNILQKTPYTFDVSLWEFCWPLVMGACLVIAKPERHKDPQYLIDQIKLDQITVLHFVPSMLRLFLSEMSSADCRGLRYVFSSGEALPNDLVKSFYAKPLKNSKLINLYGPTEATIDVSFYDCEPQDVNNTIPIGRPIYNTEFYILDSYFNRMPIGGRGELYIAGLGLAQGYLNASELTREKFTDLRWCKYKKAYKTGDLAFLSAKGLFFYEGRIDSQVKLNGYRIELKEIEANLHSSGLVKETAALVKGNQIIVFFIRKNSDKLPLEDSLYEYLKATLPLYMVPHQFIELKYLPLSSSGKLDQKTILSQIEVHQKTSGIKELPRNRREKYLVEIWSAVLGTKQLTIDDDFYSVGGDSIRSIEIVGLAQKNGITISVEQLLKARTIRKLAALIDKEPPVTLRNLPELHKFSLLASSERRLLSNNENIEDAYPLTVLQQGMVFNKILNDDVPVYQDVFHYKIQGCFREGIFRSALFKVVDHYEVLRTTFNLVDFQMPIQIVHKVIELPLESLSLVSTERYAEVVEKIIGQEQVEPIDFKNPPLFRMRVLRINENRFDIFFTLHHAILDGWSIGKVVGHLLQCYSAMLSGKEVHLPDTPKYREYVAYEALVVADPYHARFWKDYTTDFEKFLLKTNVNPGGDVALRFSRSKITFSKPLLSDLRKISVKEKVSLQTILLAAHMRLLMMLSGRRDILSGVVTHTRQAIVNSSEMVGLFLNTIPLSISLTNESWIQFIKRIQAILQEMQPYQVYPWREIAKLVDPNTLQVAEALFNFTDLYSYDVDDQPSDVTIIDGDAYEYNEFPLVCHYNLSGADEALELRLTYKTDKLDESFSERIGIYMHNILAALTENPEQEYLASNFLSDEDKDQIKKLNDTTTKISSEGILDLFAEVVSHQINDTAIVHEKDRVSFFELDQRSNQVANFLLEKGVKPDQVIGICFERSVNLVVTLLAILKCGAVYLPLLPSLPVERIKSCLAKATASHLISDFEELKLTDFDINFLMFDPVNVGSQSPVLSKTQMSLTQNMYVIYTSGTTKDPRGVAIKHKSVMNVLNFFGQKMRFSKHDALLAISEISFDISVLEIFMPLIKGAKLVIAPSNPLKNLSEIERLIQQESITTIQGTPTFLTSILNILEASPGLNKILCGGETFPISLLAIAQDDRRQVLNVYGPTETTIWSSFFEVPKAKDQNKVSVPIGMPVANTMMYILDEAFNILPGGVSGNILITGVGVATGYLKNSSKISVNTANFIEFDGSQSFITNDMGYISSANQLIFQGRSDRTTKLSGILVNLETAESILYEKFSFRRVVVIPLHGVHLLAVCISHDVKISESTIQDELSKSYPFYLLSIKVFYLDEFPLNNSGKVDSKRLAEIIQGLESNTGPININQTLVDIWCMTLGIAHSKLDNNKSFFWYGASSLDSLRFVDQVSKAFNIEIKLSDFIKNPTLGFFEKVLSSKSTQKENLPVVGFPETTPFTHNQERIWFAGYIYPNDYKLFCILELEGNLNYKKMTDTLSYIARRHPFLSCHVEKHNFQLFFRFSVKTSQVRFKIYDSSSAKLNTFINGLIDVPVDLQHELPFEVALLKISEEKHILVFMLHHLVADHESLKLLVNLFLENYKLKMPMDEKLDRATELNYIRYFQGLDHHENNEAMSLFWKAYINKKSYATHFIKHDNPWIINDIVDIPLDVVLSDAQTELLWRIAKKNNSGLFGVLLSCWASFLMLYSGQKDIVIACPVSLREWGWQGTMIANFINVLYLIFNIEDSKNLDEMLKQFQSDWSKIYPNRFYPVAKALTNLKEPQVMFVFNEIESKHFKQGGLKVELVEHKRMDEKYEITLFVEKRPSDITISLHYNRKLFSKSAIQILVKEFNEFLLKLLSEPDINWDKFKFSSLGHQDNLHVKSHSQVVFSELGMKGESIRLLNEVKCAWKQLFKLDEIDVDASIFDLGPTSLMIIKAYDALKERMPHALLEVKDLYKYHTIRGLANYIGTHSNTSNSRDINPQSIKKITETKLNIILLPPVSGQGICYADLVNGFNLHDISSNIFDLRLSKQSLFNTIEELAYSMCADIIHDCRQNQDLLLCGYSMGGVLALIMAEKLLELGFTVKGIVLIDSWAKTSKLQKNKDYLEKKFKEIIKKYDASNLLMNADDYIDELCARMQLINAYQPRGIRKDIPVFLIKAEELNPELEEIASLSNHWGKYLSIEKTYFIKANHDNLLQEPYVKEVLAAILEIYEICSFK